MSELWRVLGSRVRMVRGTSSSACYCPARSKNRTRQAASKRHSVVTEFVQLAGCVPRWGLPPGASPLEQFGWSVLSFVSIRDGTLLSRTKL